MKNDSRQVFPDMISRRAVSAFRFFLSATLLYFLTKHTNGLPSFVSEYHLVVQARSYFIVLVSLVFLSYISNSILIGLSLTAGGVTSIYLVNSIIFYTYGRGILHFDLKYTFQDESNIAFLVNYAIDLLFSTHS